MNPSAAPVTIKSPEVCEEFSNSLQGVCRQSIVEYITGGIDRPAERAVLTPSNSPHR